MSSLSAAASVLFFGSHAKGAESDIDAPRVKKHDLDDVIEPLVLKPSAPREMSELEFAGHRSHSSHSSHRSHSSHSSGSSFHSSHSSHSSHYSGTTTTPSYITTPTTPPAPIYVPRATPTPTPKPTPSPTPIDLISIEFKNGAIFYGQVIVKSPAGITFKSIDEKTYKIPGSFYPTTLS